MKCVCVCGYSRSVIADDQCNGHIWTGQIITLKCPAFVIQPSPVITFASLILSIIYLRGYWGYTAVPRLYRGYIRGESDVMT